MSAACAGQPRFGLLLVNAGDDIDTLAVIDPVTAETTPVPVPAELESQAIDRVVVGSDSRHVVLVNDVGAAVWDRVDDDSQFLGHGARIIAAHPPTAPTVLLVRSNTALLLVDLTRGRSHDLTEAVATWPDGVSPGLSVDSDSDSALVTGPGGGAVAIDLESGRKATHDEELIFYGSGLAGDGSLVIAGRRTEHGRAIEAITPFDPAEVTTWYTPLALTEQVSVAWVGDRLTAIDTSGRILDITDGRADELARIPLGPNDRPIVSRTHADREHPDSALIVVRRRDGDDWYWLSTETAELVELTAAADHEHVLATLSDTIVVGSGDYADGFSSVLLVAVGDGAVTSIHADTSTPARFATADGDYGVQLIDENHLSRFYDRDGRLLFESDEPVRSIDPASGAAAVVTRTGGEDRGVRTVLMNGAGTVLGTFPSSYPLAWLERFG